MTRSVALKVLSQLTHNDLTEYSIQAVLRGLHDKSCHVRRVAVLACAKVHKLQPEFVKEREVIDQLYALIRDSDPVVMLNCLHSLDEILRHDGGVVINKKINNYLLNRLTEVSSSLLPGVVTYLQRYQPQTEQDVYDVMNICDEYLNHTDASVVCAFTRYMLQVTHDLPAVNHQLLVRVTQPLLTLLNTANPELVFTILNFIQEIYCKPDSDHCKLIASNYGAFLCKQKDPVYVKIKRMTILCRLVTEANLKNVLDEYYTHASSSHDDISSRAITCIAAVAAGNVHFLTASLHCLTKLLSLERPHVSADVIRILANLKLDPADGKTIADIMQCVCRYSLSNDGGDVDASLLWLLGDYGEFCDSAVYVFENCFKQFQSWQDTEASTCLISTAVKLFIKRPAQCQHVLGQVLEAAFLHGNTMTKQSVKYYYSLLSNQFNATKRIVDRL